ncbi:MAG: AI-2E family transporter [Lachnospiraceae bacterium]|nr:AI-2E family transporter [Lachnospiraceae bacterium]
MKLPSDLRDKKWVPYTIATCSAVVLYMLISHLPVIWDGLGTLFRFVSPVFYGLIIAYVLNPAVRFFQTKVFHKVKREKLQQSLSVFFGLVSILIVIILLFAAVIPQLISSIVGFIDNMDVYAAGLQSLLAGLNDSASALNLNISKITEIGDNLVNSVTQTLQNNTDQIVDASLSIGNGFVTFILGLILAIYFLGDKERLLSSCVKLFHLIIPEKRFAEVSNFWSRCNSIMLRYILGDLLEGFIVGFINFLFMCIAGLPYKLLISVCVGVTNLAPTFGPIVGFLIGGFVLLFVNPWYALIFLIFTVILQTVDGYIIKPKLFGNTLGVSSVWILVCIIVGSRMFGIVGLLLAIPFAAIFAYAWDNSLYVKLMERKNQREASANNNNTEI